MFVLMLLFSAFLASTLLMVYILVSFNTNEDSTQKLTPFECGFDPLSKMRSPFSTRFFLLVVVFLVFDVEIALLFPVLSTYCSTLNMMTTSALALFLLLLLLGMFHEWNEGALDWFST